MQCNYSTESTCRETPVTLLLAICPEGHIREKYLCDYHEHTYMRYLEAGEINCPTCGLRLTEEYLMRGMHGIV